MNYLDDMEREPAPPVSPQWERIGALLLAFVVLTTTGLIVATRGVGQGSVAAPKVAVRASAVAVTVLVPGEASQRIVVAQPISGTRNEASEIRASYAYPADGSVLDVSQIAASARTREPRRRSTADVDIGSLKLFGGRVTIEGVHMAARSSITRRRATGSLELAPAAQLVVDGTATPITVNQQIVLKGVGTISINEQAIVANAPTGDRQSGPRFRAIGAAVHIRLSAAQGTVPAGTEIIVGRVDAGVRQGRVRSIRHPGYQAPSTPTPSSLTVQSGDNPFTLQSGTPRPGDPTLPRHSTSVRATAMPTSGSLQGYVFPILGDSNYVDTWGAPRASTGVPHQGTDIFAAEGTPIVAVADGVLDRVGWNSIGGYRFWLFDRYGNSFYHAHLSAYAPLAQDGARVHAGDVIGFVGDTGDARGTPFHLHFEVHPNNGDATNPFRFLNAWRHGLSVAMGTDTAGGAGGTSELALTSATDIAANSGLDGNVLDTVPDTSERPVSDETRPGDTAESLSSAIDGAGAGGR